MDRKIKSLKLILKKTDNLLLSFSYSKETLKIVLPYVKQHTKKRILYDRIESFKNLGFSLTENKSKLILALTGDKGDLSKRLKVILAKIVFEIFYFKSSTTKATFSLRTKLAANIGICQNPDINNNAIR
ncbi:MAG TPA: hypothetical protein VK616_10790 [Flavitalea sp.]|nr:hypothetical protein [Flavitalea sp.]